MAINITLPPIVEDELRAVFGKDLDQAALQGLVSEGYRTGRLSSAQVGRLLGLDNRWEVEEWLGRHGVPWSYSQDDLETDRQTARELSRENN